MNIYRLAFLLLLFCLAPRATAADSAMFPFLVSYDALPTVVNVSAWHAGPAGAQGFLRVAGGHFADDRGPVRLWGTNLCEGGCFPEKHKAERVAARLAALGINCVRLHHMDRSAIWGSSPNKLTIDPLRLERLDYLIYQLKQHGIYVDIDLHVSRSFGEAEGFTGQEQRPIFDKGLDNFEPRMIELQKKFARDLLAHVNPYTKTAYTHEPAVAMVEINNEDSLYTAYKQSWLDRLPDPYAATYRKLWNDWLRRKYSDTDRLKKAWQSDLAADQRLEDGTVAVFSRGTTGVGDAAHADFSDFIYDTERQYWLGMYRFLKDELHVQSMVIGTQMGYDPPSMQAQLDFIDSHAYWQHPKFPKGVVWDRKNWTIDNIALVNSIHIVNQPSGSLGLLASRRVLGVPYTVTEYNHASPNQYVGEGFPMVAAFGAFQGWDGIFSFAYSHSSEYEPQRVADILNISGHTAKLVHMPAAAAMFLRGDVAPARELRTAAMPAEAEQAELRRTLDTYGLVTDKFGVGRLTSLEHAIALDLNKRAATSDPNRPATKKLPTEFVSDTGQIRWDVSRRGKGFFTVDTPRTKLFTGFVDGRRFDIGPIGLAIGPSRLDWCTISLVCIDGAGFQQPGRILLAATGVVENADMKLEHVDGDRVTVHDQWGKGPVVCEGITADISLPLAAERIEFYGLDEAGRRKVKIEVTADGAKAVLPLRPAARTVWYEIVVR